MAAMNLIRPSDYALVALSVLIAMFASYPSLDLAGHVTAWAVDSRGLAAGQGRCIGTRIWCIHYIGMLAFVLPISVPYHWPTVLLSSFASISRRASVRGGPTENGDLPSGCGSILIGGGIASMHYIGMAAMRLAAICHFNSILVML